MTIEQYANKKMFEANIDEANINALDVAKSLIGAGVTIDMVMEAFKAALGDAPSAYALIGVAMMEELLREAYAKVEKEEGK